MKIHLKATQLTLALERRYSFGDKALEITVDGYELKGDLQELIIGLQDLAKKLMPELAEEEPFFPTRPETEAEDANEIK